MTPEIVRGIVWRMLLEYGASGTTTLTTTNATPTNISETQPEEGQAGIIEVRIVGVEDTGTGADTFILAAKYLYVASTLTVGTQTVVFTDNDLGSSVLIKASSGKLAVEVTGVAGTTINWRCETKLLTETATTLP